MIIKILAKARKNDFFLGKPFHSCIIRFRYDKGLRANTCDEINRVCNVDIIRR